jgi:hypothetical protein
MKFRHVVLALGLVLAAAIGLSPARAQKPLPSEYEMKAAYLFNFTKFVEWPTNAFAGTNSPLVIGVLGDDPFGGVLDSTIHSKQVNGHPFAIQRFKTPTDLKPCHVLFISDSQKKRWPKIQSTLGTNSVLTVSENWDHFTDDGGIVYFFTQDNKVCFDINDVAAKRAGLKISSKLLQLRKKPGD